jgi:hypothetical protein
LIKYFFKHLFKPKNNRQLLKTTWKRNLQTLHETK